MLSAAETRFPDVWELCGHASPPAAEMGLDAEEVRHVLESPEVCYPGSTRHPGGRYVAVGGRLAVVYVPVTGTVVTILWRGAEGRSA